MLRDIPKIYAIFFFLIIFTIAFTFWYTKGYNRGQDTLELNDAILASTVDEVDQTSRLYPGALVLANTFETSVWKKIEELYPTGSDVKFDYQFDKKDSRFTNIGNGTATSPTYRIGRDKPNPSSATYMTNRPIDAVRVSVHLPNDKASDWTYASTVTVDASSKRGR